jgi:hypothetical protein
MLTYYCLQGSLALKQLKDFPLLSSRNLTSQMVVITESEATAVSIRKSLHQGCLGNQKHLYLRLETQY